MGIDHVTVHKPTEIKRTVKLFEFQPFFDGKYFTSLRNKKRYIKNLIKKKQL